MKGTEYVNLRTQLEEVTLQLQTDHDKGIINLGYSRPLCSYTSLCTMMASFTLASFNSFLSCHHYAN